VRSAVSPSC